MSPRDRDLLAALAHFRYLSAAQLCRLVFGGLTALSYCRERLKLLYHARYVDRLFLTRTPHGSPLTVYTRHRRGTASRSTLFLEHALAITESILAVRDFTAHYHVTLTEARCAPHRMRFPIRVDGRPETITPDAYLRLVVRDPQGVPYELAWCLEVDCGTQFRRAFTRKIARYLAFIAGPYQAAFGTTACTVVVITTGGPRRLAHLQRHIERTLTQRGQTHHADLFRLTAADLDREPPAALLRTRRFRVPFRDDLVALLPEDL